MNGLGRALLDARNRKELSLRAVEVKTGVSNAYLSQLESGKIREPSPNILFKLANLYDVPYGTLMRLAGYPLPSVTQAGDSSFKLAARLGPTTSAEDEALSEYLDFIRSRGRGRRRP